MASRAKVALAHMLSSAPVGIAVGTLTRHRIRNRGLTFDTAAWDPRSEASLAFRIYESAEIRFIRSFLEGAPRAIELGGSLGVAGSHLLDVMDVDGQLTSVEANGDLLPNLRTALTAHAGGRSVTVIHAAITGASRATIAISQSNLSSRLAHDGIDVPALSLPEMVATAGYEDYVLVSDIEGGEQSFIYSPGALDGCSRMVIELHDVTVDGSRVTTDQMVAQLRRSGFNLLDRRGNVCAFEGPN